MNAIKLLLSASIFVCLFWACIFLFGYRKNPTEKRIMFWFMMTAALLFFGHYCYTNKFVNIIPVTDSLFTFTNLAVFPLYYFYIRKVTLGEKPGWRYVLLVPAVVFALAKGITYMFASQADIRIFYNCYLYSDCLAMNRVGRVLLSVHRMAAFCFACLIGCTSILSMRHIKQYDRERSAYYSNSDGKDSLSIRNLLICLIVMSAISLIMCVLGPRVYVVHPVLLTVIDLMLAVLMFAVGYDVAKRKFSYAIMKNEFNDTWIDMNDEEFEKIVFDEKEMERNRLLAARINEVMHDEKLYLQSDLKITDLALAVNSNRNYVYEALRLVMHSSFSDYVNKARIEYAQHLMEEDETQLMSEIARNSGYTSESSFYRNFKKISGQSPRDYLGSIKRRD